MNTKRTLWMGNIESWMDELYLFSLLSRAKICPLKINIRQKDFNRKGCCFLEFDTVRTANHVLQHYNGIKIDDFTLKLNCVKSNEKTYENKYTVFVGNIQKDCTSDDLRSVFDYNFASILSAKVIVDLNTYSSKGFGFVEFGDAQEYEVALQLSNKLVLHNKKLIINSAKKKKEDIDNYKQTISDSSGSSPTQQSDSPQHSSSATSLMSQNIIFSQDASFLDQDVSPDNKPQVNSNDNNNPILFSMLQRGFKDISNCYQYSDKKQARMIYINALIASNQCNYYCNLHLLQNTFGSYGYYSCLKGSSLVYNSIQRNNFK